MTGIAESVREYFAPLVAGAVLRSLADEFAYQRGHDLGVRDVYKRQEFLTAMRSSVILMGVLLGRCREAQAGYPGGCTIGKRPIDLHLYALKRCV